MKSLVLGTALVGLMSSATLAAQPIMPPDVPAGVALSELGSSANKFGIPTADQIGMEPAQYANFLAKLQGATRTAPRMHNDFHGMTNVVMGFPKSLRQIDATTYGSYNWSGSVPHAVPGASASISASEFIPQVHKPKTVSCSLSPIGWCVGGGWIGMGGFESGDCTLGQVGEIDAADDAGDAITPSFFWEEITNCTNPEPAQFFGSPNTSDFYEPYMWLTPGNDNFLVYDVSQNLYFSFQVVAPQHHSLEFIPREAVTVGGQISPLPQGSALFLNARTASPTSTCYASDIVDMFSPYTGKQIVTASCVGGFSTTMYVSSMVNPLY